MTGVESINTGSQLVKPLTQGQANALVTTALGSTAVIGGIITENPFMVYAGAGVLTEGLVLSVIEFIFNGDTTGYPNPNVISYEILQGIYDYNMGEDNCK